MAMRGLLALTRRLNRELAHRAWLRTNLPRSAQLRQCERRILVLRSEIAGLLGAAVGR